MSLRETISKAFKTTTAIGVVGAGLYGMTALLGACGGSDTPPPPEPIERTQGGIQTPVQQALVGPSQNEITIDIPPYFRPYDSCVNNANSVGKDPGSECDLHEETSTRVSAGVESADVWRTGDGRYAMRVHLLGSRGEKSEAVVYIQSCNGQGECSAPATYVLSILTDRSAPSIQASQMGEYLVAQVPADTTKVSVAECSNPGKATPMQRTSDGLNFAARSNDRPGDNCRVLRATDSVGNTSETQFSWTAPVSVLNPSIQTNSDGTWEVSGQLQYNPVQIGNPKNTMRVLSCDGKKTLGDARIDNGMFRAHTNPGYDPVSDRGCVRLEGTFDRGTGLTEPLYISNYNLGISMQQMRAQLTGDGGIDIALLSPPSNVASAKTTFDQKNWRALFDLNRDLHTENIQGLDNNFSVRVAPPRRKGDPYVMTFATCDRFGNCATPITFNVIDPPDPNALEVFAMKTVPELGSLALLLSSLVGGGYALQRGIKRRTNEKRIQADVNRHVSLIISGKLERANEYIKARYPASSPFSEKAHKEAQSGVLTAFHREVNGIGTDGVRAGNRPEVALRLYKYICSSGFLIMDEQIDKLAGIVVAAGITREAVAQLAYLRNKDFRQFLRHVPEDRRQGMINSVMEYVIKSDSRSPYLDKEYRSIFGEPVMSWVLMCWHANEGQDERPKFRAMVDSLTPQERTEAVEKIQRIKSPETRLHVLSYFVDPKGSTVNEDRLRYTTCFMRTYEDEISRQLPATAGPAYIEQYVSSKLGQRVMQRIGHEMVEIICAQVRATLLTKASKITI